MISINKKQIQEKYQNSLTETIKKNKEIDLINKLNFDRIESEFSIAFNKAKLEHNLKTEKIEIENSEIEKINSENKIIFEKEKQNIIDWNNFLDNLMSFKVRIFNSSGLDIFFDNAEIIVFDNPEFKEIAQFEISKKEDIDKIKMFLSSDFKLARNTNTEEHLFLIKVDFGWEDYNGVYYGPLDIEILDKKLKDKKIDKKKIPVFKSVSKKMLPGFKRPEKEKYVEIKHISLPIIGDEIFVGIPQNMNNFNNKKINIINNGSWKF